MEIQKKLIVSDKEECKDILEFYYKDQILEQKCFRITIKLRFNLGLKIKLRKNKTTIKIH